MILVIIILVTIIILVIIIILVGTLCCFGWSFGVCFHSLGLLPDVMEDGRFIPPRFLVLSFLVIIQLGFVWYDLFVFRSMPFDIASVRVCLRVSVYVFVHECVLCMNVWCRLRVYLYV